VEENERRGGPGARDLRFQRKGLTILPASLTMSGEGEGEQKETASHRQGAKSHNVEIPPHLLGLAPCRQPRPPRALEDDRIPLGSEARSSSALLFCLTALVDPVATCEAVTDVHGAWCAASASR